MKKIILIIFTLVAVYSIPYEKNTYYVESIKYNETNMDNYLIDVSLSGIDFTFDSNITDYTITVPYSKTNVEVDYTPYDDSAIVNVIGGNELYIGNNSLSIIVTSIETGLTRSYNFTIIRSEDSKIVDNNTSSIASAISSDTSEIILELNGSAVNLDTNILNTFKNTNKTLIFKWLENGLETSRLTIKSTDIKDTSYINPNISKSITDTKLLKYMEDYDYIGISTKDTNIPEGSIYKISIDGVEDIYYLYYYDNDILNKKPLRNVDGTLEFEVKDGIDYAIVISSEHPTLFENDFISLIRPAFMIFIIIVIIYLIIRCIIITMIRKPKN